MVGFGEGNDYVICLQRLRLGKLKNIFLAYKKKKQILRFDRFDRLADQRGVWKNLSLDTPPPKGGGFPLP